MAGGRAQKAQQLLEAILDKALRQIPCFAGSIPSGWTDKVISQFRKMGVPELIIPVLLDMARDKGFAFTPTTESEMLRMQLTMKYPPPLPPGWGRTGNSSPTPQTGYHSISKSEYERSLKYVPPGRGGSGPQNPNAQGQLSAARRWQEDVIRNEGRNDWEEIDVEAAP